MNLSKEMLSGFLIGIDTQGRGDDLSMSVQSAWRIRIRQALLKGLAGSSELPVEFRAELDAPCGIGRRDGSEIVVAQIGVWLEEVRMIEYIEHFEAELQLSRLAESQPFFDAHVVVEEFGRSQI
jgi:hypothetical protein